MAAIQAEGFEVVRAHPYDPVAKHGFIHSQKHGMEVFRNIPAGARIVVVEAVWQYTHHVLSGLYSHTGPILTLANWSGEWPGLVGMLNLNGSLTKAGVPYDTLWSIDFTDAFFRTGLHQWLHGEPVTHDLSHVTGLADLKLPAEAESVGAAVAAELQRDKAIMGIFDEGCMGMYNAIIPDELLHATGIFKERLSQSALYAAMRTVPDEEAHAIREWLDARGMKFHTGSDEATELTDHQILEQCKMYIAALRIADNFGCDLIGIQYQQGLKDLVPASDLVEGLLNNVDRPPVKAAGNGRVLYEGKALPHFNEVDECAGVDALVTNRVWTALGYDPETTLHDIRYGEEFDGQFVWVFEISGAVPPQHNVGGYAGLCRRTAATDVLPLRRLDDQRPGQAGRDCLEPRVCREQPAQSGPGNRHRGFIAGRGDTTPLGHHHAAMAGDERPAARSVARSTDGPSQGQSHPGGLCAGCGGGPARAGRQSRRFPGNGLRSGRLRYGSRPYAID